MRISNYRILNTKERLTAYGLLLLAFLSGVILPSPFFNRMANNTGDTKEVELTDTTNMKLADGIYNGSIIKGSCTRHGYGRFEKHDGAIYEGDWKDDFLPYGKRTTPSSIYMGHFSKDYCNEGFGIVNYSQKYISGKSKQGIPDSEIVSTYLGNWHKDMKNGLGRSVKKDGSMEFGNYANGVFQPVAGANYRVGGSVYGFDASHFQDDIDWDQLALFCDKNGNVFNKANGGSNYMQPVFFVYLKATEGATIKDEMYSVRMIEAERHGVVRGAYHFFRMGSDVDSQLKNFFETATWTSNDLPPALDIEVESEIQKYGVANMQKMALEWLQKVEEKMGVTPIIYTRENIRNKYLNDARFRKYKFWIARYSDKGPENFDWQIWQRTESARMNGHNGNIDVNLFRGDYNAFTNYLTNINVKNEI